jgi:hypothetical protein
MVSGPNLDISLFDFSCDQSHLRPCTSGKLVIVISVFFCSVNLSYGENFHAYFPEEVDMRTSFF